MRVAMIFRYTAVFFILVYISTTSNTGFAQQAETNQRVIHGSVLDTLQRPLEGATVRIIPRGSYSITDQHGAFSIAVPDSVQVAKLQLSFQGKESLEVAAAPVGRSLTLIMRDTRSTLEEVVVTGYGDLERRRSAGSVSIVLPEELDKGVRNLDEMLQGKVPGVVSTAQSGRPGERYKVVIRGTNTIGGSTEPLWVVDGVPLQQNVPNINSDLVKSENINEILNAGIGHVDPADIEQITILKDASAAAIYGSRAAGGVIVITTKRGKAGPTRIGYSTNLNMGLKPQRDAGLMDAGEKLAWEKELWDTFSADRFAGSDIHVPIIGIYGMLQGNKLGQGGKLWMEEGFTPYTAAEKENLLSNLSGQSTDWFDVLFQNSFAHNHHLSFSGGTDRSDYYVSLGYTGQEGLVQETGYDRFNLNSRINTKVGERLSLGWNIGLSRQQSDSYSMGTNPFEYAYFANPYERPYGSDGQLVDDLTYHVARQVNDGTATIISYEPPFGYNILREMENTHSDSYTNNAVLTMNADYKISNTLQFSGLASYTYAGNRSENRIGAHTFAAFEDRLFFDTSLDGREWQPYGSIMQSSADANSYNARGHFIYSNTFAQQHGLRVRAGAEIRGNHSKRIFTKRYGYNDETRGSTMPTNPNPDENYTKEYTALINSLSGQSLEDSRFASFYAATDYTFRSRYVLNATVRTDGSNNFGSGEQFNPTWSLGAAWHIDEEPFFQHLKSIFNTLTIRAATGFTGNVVPGNKKYLVITQDQTDWNGLPVGNISNPPNPNLRWEKTRDRKISLDFGLLSNRISGTVETYSRRHSDIITQSMLNNTTGFGMQNYNTSRIENRGLEAMLQLAVVRGKDVQLTLGGNIAWNQNKLTAYYNGNGEENNLDLDRANEARNAGLYVGYPVNGLFGGNYQGIDPYFGVYSFALRPDAQLVSSADLNNPQNYVHYLGTPEADVTGGVSLRAAYKNISLSLGASFFSGRHVINNLQSPVHYNMLGFGNSSMFEKPQSHHSDLYRNYLNVRRDVTNRWTEDRKTDVAYPRLVDYAGERLNLDAYNPFQQMIVNSAFLEDVSFFRLRDITMGYSLPAKWLAGSRLRSLSLSGTLNNFFTFTNYSGIDAETPGATYPITRSVFFRLQAGF